MLLRGVTWEVFWGSISGCDAFGRDGKGASFFGVHLRFRLCKEFITEFGRALGSGSIIEEGDEFSSFCWTGEGFGFGVDASNIEGISGVGSGLRGTGGGESKVDFSAFSLAADSTASRSAFCWRRILSTSRQ